jgi:Bacterial PH domain
VFRLAPPVVLWWVWLAFAVANVADFAVQGAPARLEAVVLAILATVTGLAYALALRPRVVADAGGLAIMNPFRDHRVPWGAIQAVDTGDWVRVHYAPGADAPEVRSSAPGIRSSAPEVRSSAAARSVSCWALYVSARAKRKAAVPSRRPAGSRLVPPMLWPRVPEPEPGYAERRLPEEAKYLASLPPAQAIAARLDTRARKERARAATPAGPVTARWAWPRLAAVVLPALALLIVVLA